MDNRRRWVLGGLAISLACFIIFKIGYPYPDFFSDSYSYLFAADADLNTNIWPIGYSKFLSLVHLFSASDTVLVAIQYFFLQGAALYFFFTVVGFYPLGRWAKLIFWLFIVVNPLSLYLCNTVNSDALFTALTLVWLSLLIRLLHRPGWWLAILHALLLFLCFTVRNNAYYYPIVAVLPFWLCRRSPWFKLSGIVLPLVLLVLFVQWTRNETFRITGTRQYSLFTGWQLANNALYIYDRISVDSTLFVTPEAREVNRMMIGYLGRQNLPVYRERVEESVGNYFIRAPDAPLKQYYSMHADPSDRRRFSVIRHWARCSAAFEPFGKPILLHYPLAYGRYFVGPNLWRYFLPPLSHIGLYNYGQAHIEPIAQRWFGYHEPQVWVVSYTLQGGLYSYALLFFVLNVTYVFLAVAFLLQWRKGGVDRESIALFRLMSAYLLFNGLFSLAATVNILRYQVAPMYILLLGSLWLGLRLNASGAAKAEARKPEERQGVFAPQQ